jgi:hypothetical protein
MSVKDRWVGPREQVLNVSIACRRYVSGKPTSWLSTEACFFLTALLSVMGEKLGTDPQTSQPVCCGLDREQWICSNLLTTMRNVALC